MVFNKGAPYYYGQLHLLMKHHIKRHFHYETQHDKEQSLCHDKHNITNNNQNVQSI